MASVRISACASLVFIEISGRGGAGIGSASGPPSGEPR